MKPNSYFQKQISIFVILILLSILCLYENMASATSIPKENKESENTLKESRPNVFEQEGQLPTMKKKNFPLLLVIGATVVIASVVVLLLSKSNKKTLTVNLGQGTQGNPNSTKKYKTGEIVNYSYTASSSNNLVVVKLDGTRVANSGQVTMDKDHTLDIYSSIPTFVNGILTINGITYEMALIPAGTFQMGLDHYINNYTWERPQHNVTITKDFWLGKTEITQKIWKEVMQNNPSYHQGDGYPVEQVSWNDCQSFVQKLNTLLGGNYFRLPTEAEWEYACRAGTTGDRYGNSNDIAWWKFNSGGESHQVGLKQPNAWQLYDMLGNVWEWVNDFKTVYTSGDQIDPQGAPSGTDHMIRGSDFWSQDKNLNETAPCWARDFGVASTTSLHGGFRLARTKN